MVANWFTKTEVLQSSKSAQNKSTLSILKPLSIDKTYFFLKSTLNDINSSKATMVIDFWELQLLFLMNKI